jgi:hypothetical protein
MASGWWQFWWQLEIAFDAESCAPLRRPIPEECEEKLDSQSLFLMSASACFSLHI